MRTITYIFLMLLSLGATAQYSTIAVNNLKARDSIVIGGGRITAVGNDTTLATASQTKVISEYAVKKYIQSKGITSLQENYILVGKPGGMRHDTILQLTPGTLWGRHLIFNTPKSNAVQDVLYVKSQSTHAGALGFRMRLHYSGNGDGTANTPMQWGFNGDGTDDPDQWGISEQMENRYISGGLLHLERITNVFERRSGAHPFGRSVRIFMQTFKARDSLENSENQTDIRGTSFELKTLMDKGYFSAAGNHLGTSVGIRDVATGYGMDYKTDGAASMLYNVGHGAGTDGIVLKWDSINRFEFSTLPNAPYLTVNNPSGTAMTWSNMQLEGLKIIRGASPAKLQFMFSASTSIFNITADHNTGITSFYAPSGGYGQEFYANGNLAMALPATGGILPYRMTTSQRLAIASPAEGLEVYDFDLHKKMVYDGTTWQACW